MSGTGNPRSYLYVPGDRPDMLAKAVGRGADALIVDLEDAVAAAAKDAARAGAAAFLAGHRRHRRLWVRVNAGDEGLHDLEAVVGPGLAGVCVPKTASAADVGAVAEMLTRLEDERALPAGTVGISPLLESAAGVLAAREIASAPRVVRLQVGEADLRADLGAEPGPDDRELLWVRSLVVLASAAAGIAPPVGPVSTDYQDLDALRTSTLALRRMGYRGRACVHPAQVGVVNGVFTPSAGEVTQARQLVAAYEAAVAGGSGVFTDARGRMVDAAVVRGARDVLARAATPPEE